METAIVSDPLQQVTEMGWPIVPAGLHQLLRWLNDRYGGLPIVIAENGAALDDQPDADGFVEDRDRIRYLADHIAAMAAAMESGVDVRGYFVWSLMDNLEWSLGYSKRFGLIHCDRTTLERTIKASGHWYASVIAAGALVSETLGQAVPPTTCAVDTKGRT